MKLDKKQNRLRRARRARAKIRDLAVNRLSIHRTPRHIYAQVIDDDAQSTLCAASTLDKDLRTNLQAAGSSCDASIAVGELVAKRAIAKGIQQVVFDRGGNLYHGRVKALADAAREAGLQF